MRLVNVRTRNPKQEWREIVAFFKVAEYAPKGRDSWPEERIEAVVKEWRVYRDLTREMVLARVPADWLKITRRYPPDLVERAMRMPPEKADRGEVYDPLDQMWIALTYGHIYEHMKGPRFAKCATVGCDRFVPAPWPPSSGRPPRFCEPECGRLQRDLASHKRRKHAHDEKARELLRAAWRRLPAIARKIEKDQDRMPLAVRLFQTIRKAFAEIPGVRSDRWVAKQLKREEFNGKKKRARGR
jgi:hypothetical protein